MLLGRDISPEIPRTHTNLLANIVDTENRTTGIGAGNDESLLDTLDRVLDDHTEKRLPFAFDLRDIDLTALDEAVDEGRLADSSRENDGLGRIGVRVGGAGEGFLV